MDGILQTFAIFLDWGVGSSVVIFPADIGQG